MRIAGLLTFRTLTFRVAARFTGQHAWFVFIQAIRDAVSNIKVETPSPETVFDGVELQRLRLHHDQQVPEWE